MPTGELAVIRDLRRRFRTPLSTAVNLGIGDDCALLTPPPGHQIAVTTDLLIEGRHFRRDTHTARSAGHRCLARGLSDLAAMGATPLAAFLSLALPRSTTTPAGRRWLQGFLAGLHALATRMHTPLAGGDTGESPTDAFHADIVLLGTVPAGSALTRSGARPGDSLWVSGTLGGSAAQLRHLLHRAEAANSRSRSPQTRPGPQTHPEPRIPLGQALLRRNLRAPGTITACIDLSDGLSSDVRRLCEESATSPLDLTDIPSPRGRRSTTTKRPEQAGPIQTQPQPLRAQAQPLRVQAQPLRVQIISRLLPIHPLAASQPDALTLALSGGEDYELLFTTRPGARLPPTLAGARLTRIGTLLSPLPRAPLVTLLDHNGHESPLAPAGFEHLR